MLRFFVFFVVLAGVLFLINALLVRWSTQAFGLRTTARRWLYVILLTSLFTMTLGRWLRHWVEELAPVVAWASMLQLAVVISVALLLPFALLRVLRNGARWLAARRRRSMQTAERERGVLAEQEPSVEQAPERDAMAALPRRSFLETSLVGSSLLIASSSSLYGALIGRHDYQIVEVPVKLPGLKPALDGFTIVQLSDIHIGDYTGEAELAAAYDLVQRARPDLIVLTGDLLDHDASLAEQLGRFSHRLAPLARHGVVAVSGNHDFFAGIDETVSALERAGTRVLRNGAQLIGDPAARFALLGVDDVMGPRFGGFGPDLQTAQRRAPESLDLPSILLCHNPVYFERAAGKVQLQLSGHTHGGQVNLLVSPASLVLPHGWVAGMYEDRGSKLYVNRGFGTVGPPARIGAPPEVTKLVLHS